MTRVLKSVLDKSNLNPLVSVIVVTYNSSKFVLETLESAKAQTYQNLELIITDDSSKDDTVEVCKKWLDENNERFVRVQILSVEANTGIPANINRGLKVAKGEWIKSIAGDDKLVESCISKNIYFVKNNNIQVLFSEKEQYVDDFKDKNYLRKVTGPPNFFNEKITAKEQYEMLLIKNRIIVTPTFFIKTDLHLKFLADERFKFCDDYPLWLKLTEAGYKLHFMPDVTVLHRAHEDSVHNSTKKFLINPAYFRNEELRKILVYPKLKWKYRMGHYYKRLMVSFLIKMYGNEVHTVSIISSKVLLKYFNPFYWLNN